MEKILSGDDDHKLHMEILDANNTIASWQQSHPDKEDMVDLIDIKRIEDIVVKAHFQAAKLEKDPTNARAKEQFLSKVQELAELVEASSYPSTWILKPLPEAPKPDSAWFGCIPIPRLVANQVNHRLELRMKELDSEILKDADDLLQTKKQHAWVVGTLALFLVLHIRELDAGRNIFWKRYKDPLGFWIHPSKPQALIEEAIASSNSLLSHYHYVFGRKPLDMNWTNRDRGIW